MLPYSIISEKEFSPMSDLRQQNFIFCDDLLTSEKKNRKRKSNETFLTNKKLKRDRNFFMDFVFSTKTD
jgi:hypothetical protein